MIKKMFFIIMLFSTFVWGKTVAIKVTATAYTSHKGQTDKTPFLAAWNNKLHPVRDAYSSKKKGWIKGAIAISRDLQKKYGITNGSIVILKKKNKILGAFRVKDKMNKRFTKKIDIYFGLDKKRALKWGVKKLTLSVFNKKKRS